MKSGTPERQVGPREGKKTCKGRDNGLCARAWGGSANVTIEAGQNEPEWDGRKLNRRGDERGGLFFLITRGESNTMQQEMRPVGTGTRETGQGPR